MAINKPIEMPNSLFEFLVKNAPNQVFFSIVFGLLAGLASAMIIPLIIQSIELEHMGGLRYMVDDKFHVLGFEISNERYALTFFLVCGFILIARTVSLVLLQQVSIDASMRLRIYFYDRISQLPTINMEKIGPSQLHASIANDVPTLMTGAKALPVIIVNIANIVGLLCFLIYLNIDIFLFIIGSIMIGTLTYQLPLYFGKRYYAAAREAQDKVQEGIRGLIYGAKELKLNNEKYRAFLQEELITHETNHCRNLKAGSMLAIAALSYGNLIAFFTIGLVTYVVSNLYNISPYTLVAIAMAMLYITGPLGGILNMTSTVVKGSVALTKLTRLLNDMPIEKRTYYPKTGTVNHLRLFAVENTYGDADTHFKMGPIDLQLDAGEVTFITGGNGSGKSTLGKVLSLLYTPSSGQVYFNEQEVTKENCDQYRQNVAAIFTDFYLFPRIYGIDKEVIQAFGTDYLRYLKLDDKVAIQDGKFTTTSLSDGQKKRLALLVQYLENKDIYIFDEWAADQDPVFKHIFYNRILKDLKNKGKIVIVISHDDRYFHLADKLVRMENGQIVQEQKYNEASILDDV